ncbi:MAG: T9SS type A sorting domain-containing protein [Flavobacteriales bacterium]|nr:T9SS type A sorting domain-containing protein [Flavobacteriales bacterium]
MDSEAQLLLSPNPNRGDALQVRFSGGDVRGDHAVIEVFDLVGQRVINQQIPVTDGVVNTTVGVEGMASGTYLFSLTVDGKRSTQRLVVSR